MGKARVDLVLDCADPQRLAEFWRDALGYRILHSLDTIAVLVPPEPPAPPLVLQKVPEPKTVKNRMHIDLTVQDGDIEREVVRLEGLGARRAHDGVQHFGETRWVTMHDPEGNEFCVCTGVEW